MGMTEKNSLINSITIQLVEDYNLPIKEIKAKLTEIMQQYHVTISNEVLAGNDFTTEYLFKKFSEGKSAVGMTEKTIKQYYIAVKKLETYTAKQLSDIDAEDITNFLRDYGKVVSDITLRAKYQLLSSIYSYLFQHKYIAYNPMAYIDTPKSTVIYKAPMTELDIEKMRKVIEQLPQKQSLRDMAILNFFLSTGCRVSELCNVRIADVNLDEKICKVKGKGKKERPVVLTDRTCYRIKLYLETRTEKDKDAPLFAHVRGKETAMTKDGIERLLNKIKTAAGLEHITCHSFRRFYATELRRRGVNIQMIATSLGHANLNQINRYSLYNNAEMLETVRNAM